MSWKNKQQNSCQNFHQLEIFGRYFILLLLFGCWLVIFVFLWRQGILGGSWTRYVVYALDPPASTSWLLAFLVCATMPHLLSARDWRRDLIMEASTLPTEAHPQASPHIPRLALDTVFQWCYLFCKHNHYFPLCASKPGKTTTVKTLDNSDPREVVHIPLAYTSLPKLWFWEKHIIYASW